MREALRSAPRGRSQTSSSQHLIDASLRSSRSENNGLRRHVNIIGEVGCDVVVAGAVLGTGSTRWPVTSRTAGPLPCRRDFVWCIHNITRRRWATSKDQAVADLFYKLHLEPREWSATAQRSGHAVAPELARRVRSNQSDIASPVTMARATGEGSEPSRTNPSGTCTAGWAIIRGAGPRCGQVAVCTMNGWHR